MFGDFKNMLICVVCGCEEGVDCVVDFVFECEFVFCDCGEVLFFGYVVGKFDEEVFGVYDWIVYFVD